MSRLPSILVNLLLLISNASIASSFEFKQGSRRDFLRAAPFVAGIATTTTTTTTTVPNHPSYLFGNIQPALAYERRDVGGDYPSAVMQAMNAQSVKTNDRLEQSGFKLDTREEEKARLSSAMASFSYDGATTKTKGGYRASSNPTSKK